MYFTSYVLSTPQHTIIFTLNNLLFKEIQKVKIDLELSTLLSTLPFVLL